MSDAYKPTPNPPTPGYTNPANPTPNPNPIGSSHTTHVRQSQPSTNWFAWLLGGAVVVVGLGALFFSGNDTTPVQSPGGNNVTIESPAIAPGLAPAAPGGPATATPDPVAPPIAPDGPAVADPVAPSPDVAPVPAPETAPAPDTAPDAAPAPSGN